MINTVKGFSIVNEAEDVFLEFPCFFYGPTNAGNLMFDSSAFFKFSLYIWKFSVHKLLKPSLEDFDQDFVSKCNCAVVWTFFGIAFLGVGMKTNIFQSCGHCWVFQISWHVECSTFTASPFRILNSSAGIPSPSLEFSWVMLPKSNLILHYRMSGSRWVIKSWLSRLLRSF